MSLPLTIGLEVVFEDLRHFPLVESQDGPSDTSVSQLFRTLSVELQD